jgi:hypothetical protein
MKNHSKFFLAIVVTALACALIPSPAFAADTGKLTVKRSAKFGKSLVLGVYLDGKHVASLTLGQSYTTELPAGAHDVKVNVAPQKPLHEASKQVTIEAGKDSTVTASWDGQQLSLQ